MSAAPGDPAAVRRCLPWGERRARLREGAPGVFAERGGGVARHAGISERAEMGVSGARWLT